MTTRGLISGTSRSVAVSVWTVNANTQLAAVFYAFPCLLKSRYLAQFWQQFGVPAPLSHHCSVLLHRKLVHGDGAIFDGAHWMSQYKMITRF
jgi:hypothetical protein